KMGNHYVRTTIIEANQYSFMPVKVSRWLTKRRMEINPKYIEIEYNWPDPTDKKVKRKKSFFEKATFKDSKDEVIYLVTGAYI
ncbi:MAG: hypothetical protein HQK53_00550, partial [Oligoflexia bacterium]|nr:hypothetical protein [Oligoflexia bacterium]